MRIFTSIVVALVMILSGCLSAMPVDSHEEARQRLIKSLAELDAQRAILNGRRSALNSPTLRVDLQKQAIAESRSLGTDPTTASEWLDSNVTTLEQISLTPPHDRRLRRLIVNVLHEALRDPELRPLLVEALRQALPPPPRPEPAPSPAPVAEPKPPSQPVPQPPQEKRP